jgi:hypothetical protein
MNADLKSVDEDKDRVFAKLADEVKAMEDLQGKQSIMLFSSNFSLRRTKQEYNKVNFIMYIK